MEAIIPSLVGHPVDDLAAATIWYRLSADSLTDILPFLSNARQDNGVLFYDLTHDNIRKFTAEQRAQEGGPASPLYDMLSNIGHLFLKIHNIRYNIGGICAEVCYEKGKSNPDALLKITSGNKHLNTHD